MSKMNCKIIIIGKCYSAYKPTGDNIYKIWFIILSLPVLLLHFPKTWNIAQRESQLSLLEGCKNKSYNNT